MKYEIELQDMQSVLMDSAIELRKAENIDESLRLDSARKRVKTDSVLKLNFKKFSRPIEWGFFDANGNSIDSLNYKTDITMLKSSSLKVCTSCLIMIDILDEQGDSTIDRGYILSQSPSQMKNIRGLDNSKIKYLHLFVEPNEFSIKPYILPCLFLIGLAILFFWVVYLNTKQYKLIRQKNEFVNHLSHQFQTPLSSIKLSANMLSNDNLKNKSDLIQVIQTESNRLENHIKTVLNWVKSDADRLQIEKKNLSVTNVVEKSLKQMKPIFVTNNTKVNFIPPDEDVIIHADPTHLQLILFNIWENSIKHNDVPVTLNISCMRVKNQIQITTKDNGVGMNSTENIKFKGLGLAYVGRIMTLHEGTMLLVNTNEEGLQVNLNFPYYD